MGDLPPRPMDPDSTLPLSRCLPLPQVPLSHFAFAVALGTCWAAGGHSSSQELPVALWSPAPFFALTALGPRGRAFTFSPTSLAYEKQHSQHRVLVCFAHGGVGLQEVSAVSW